MSVVTTEKLVNEDKINQQRVNDIYLEIAPNWGFLDIQEAIRVIYEAGYNTVDLIDAIREYKESCDIDSYDDIDPAAIAYDHIFQAARNHIESLLHVDIEDKGYYAYGDGVASFIDSPSLEKHNEFGEFLKSQPLVMREMLVSNNAAKFFFVHTDLSHFVNGL